MAVTYSQAVEAYLDNADFEEDASLSKAKAFVTACVQLAVLLPSSASFGASAQSFDVASIKAAQTRALDWIQAYEASTTSPAVRFFSFRSDYR